MFKCNQCLAGTCNMHTAAYAQKCHEWRDGHGDKVTHQDLYDDCPSCAAKEEDLQILRARLSERESAHSSERIRLSEIAAAKQDAYALGLADAHAATKRESGWVKIRNFRGEPNSAPLAWWWGTDERMQNPALDEVLLDEDGEVCGKGGCGAMYYTHVMLAVDSDFPKPPEQGRRESSSAPNMPSIKQANDEYRDNCEV